MTERIIAAAIQYSGLPSFKSGEAAHSKWSIVVSLSPPARHHDIIYLVTRNLQEIEQGFLTSGGRFVDRKEALQIALAAKQIEAPKFQPDELFSEDLW